MYTLSKSDKELIKRCKLFKCVRDNNTKTFSEMLDVENINWDLDGRTLLQHAIRERKPDILQIMLDFSNSHNCALDIHSRSNGSVLHMGSYFNLRGMQHIGSFRQSRDQRFKREILSLLLKFDNADPNCYHVQNWTPLQTAILYGDETICEVLINCEKCDVNCKGNIERSPLQLACSLGKIDIVTMLLNRGCELDC